jgi:uncharacterized membrane protein
MVNKRVKVVAVVAAALSLATGCLHQIDDVGGDAHTAAAHAINDHGTVAGKAWTPDGWHAFVRVRDGRSVDITPDHHGDSEAIAVNRDGVVTGNIRTYTPSGEVSHAFVWSSAGLDVLPLPDGMVSAAATDINDNGQVLLIAYPTPDGTRRSFRWDPLVDRADLPGAVSHAGAYTELPPLNPGRDAFAFGLNNQGTAVGMVRIDDFPLFAPAIWEAGSPARQLAVTGGERGVAFDLNESGQIVGRVELGPLGQSNKKAAYWPSGSTPSQELSTPPGDFSDAEDINEAGQIVGFSAPGGRTPAKAVVWRSPGGERVELQDKGNGAVAHDLNNAGEIAGEATLPEGNTIAVWWDWPAPPAP